MLAAYTRLQAAGDAVSRIIESGLLPGAMEIMDRLAMDAAEAAVQAGYPTGAAAVLIVELEGEDPQVAAEFDGLMRILSDSATTHAHVAATMTERARIWKGRKCAFSAVGRLSPDFIVQDGVVPRARLGEALATIEALSRTHGSAWPMCFTRVTGTFTRSFCYDGREAGAHDRAEVLAAEILRLCIRLGDRSPANTALGSRSASSSARCTARPISTACGAPLGDGSAWSGEHRQKAGARRRPDRFARVCTRSSGRA